MFIFNKDNYIETIESSSKNLIKDNNIESIKDFIYKIFKGDNVDNCCEGNNNIEIEIINLFYFEFESKSIKNFYIINFFEKC